MIYTQNINLKRYDTHLIMSITPASEILKLVEKRQKEAEDLRLGKSKRQQEQYLDLVEDFNKFIQGIEKFPLDFGGN